MILLLLHVSGCADKDNRCSRWASEGYCTKPQNAAWMRNNCANSCKVCDGGGGGGGGILIWLIITEKSNVVYILAS